MNTVTGTPETTRIYIYIYIYIYKYSNQIKYLIKRLKANCQPFYPKKKKDVLKCFCVLIKYTYCGLSKCQGYRKVDGDHVRS